MSPLQRIGLGLVVVVASATVGPSASQRYDLLADPLGWALVLWGVLALGRVDGTGERLALLRWPALLAGIVSVPMWLPQLRHRLDAPLEWTASLPQLLFCLLLCRLVAELARERGERGLGTRFGLLGWGFVVVALLPAVTLGGDVPALAPTTALVALAVALGLVWSLFAVHRRPWLGGPGDAGTGRQHPARTHGGRPPSS
ncbi:hypothetical protein SAMN04488570_2952 [Nocardioides scoriae]|uniref:Uncharacterized protein n=1 Tax=Nocardioides scoriae TaxID=642780 RepID=A0A1H1VV16_9ACTN|nr:hypothetical protein [Nocardioides scoriae]SDS88754.1 hypothetical protein SAMN04488570_2952 [Nocardioides scoriae]